MAQLVMGDRAAGDCEGVWLKMGYFLKNFAFVMVLLGVLFILFSAVNWLDMEG